MKKMPRSEANSMPPNTAVPTARRVSIAAPVAVTSGTSPRMKAKLVIITGRKRCAGAHDRGVEQRHSFLTPLLGELDDQDRVLAGERDQHDDADLGIDVEREAGDVQREERAEQADDHREQDRHRDHPALVERHQEQVSEQDGEAENDQGVARLRLLQRRGGPFVTYSPAAGSGPKPAPWQRSPRRC